MKDFDYKKQLVLHEAILFATGKHAGQKRKGTDIDYICHPLEVLSILTAASPRNVALQIAGVLHDTVEDTDTTLEEIRKHFGEKVEDYVAFMTEDKTQSWCDRREATVKALQHAKSDDHILMCADKLANLRDMCIGYQKSGEPFWDRFNASKEDIQWYYKATLTAMRNLSIDALTADLFGEAKVRYEELFGPLFENIWC